MRVLLLCACALATASAAFGQSASLRGFVTDAESGEVLEGATVVLRNEAEGLRGVATDRAGSYVLRVPPGEYVLDVSFLGFDTFTDTLSLAPDELRRINVELEPAAEALDEVVVQSERGEGAAQITAGQQTVRPADIALVPSPDLSADLATYLITQPGVVSTGDRGGQLFIRGGEPSQNLVLLDGITLYQPFHVISFYSAFPADILQSTDVYAGGFGARFSNRLSSVIDVQTRSGNNRRLSGALTASPYAASARLEGPIIPGRISFLGSYRQSLIEQTGEPLVGRDLPFHFGDGFGKISVELSRKSRLSVTGLTTFDRGTLTEAFEGSAVEPEEVRWQNRALGARYTVLPDRLPVTMRYQVSYSQLTTELGTAAAPSRTSAIDNWSLTIDASFFGTNVNTDAGLAVRLVALDSELGGLYQNIQTRETTLDHLAFYAEPDIRVGGGLRVRPGLRLQFYEASFEPYIEPRLRLVWNRGAHQVSGAAGLYHQEVVGLNDRRDAASVFTAWASIPKADPDSEDVRAGRLADAVHGILGYRVGLQGGVDVSVEGFYKQMSNLFISEWTAYPRFTTNLQPASGTSRGLDLRIELRRPDLYAYVNYGLSSTRYEAEQAALQLWYGTETLRFRPPHDRRHQLNALASTSARGFDLSARWEFGSGLPFSRALGFDGFILVDEFVDVRTDPGSRRVIYERPYNGILPTYHRLDLSVERLFETALADVTVQASVINVYDRRNLFYLDVFTLDRVDQLPIAPSLGLKVAF